MHALAQRIATLQRRLALRERAMTGCRIAATVLAAALLLGLLDYWVRIRDPGLRIMATAAFVAAAIWAVYRWWYLPSRRPFVPLEVARRVEARFPQLRDSLASAIEFLQQSEEDRTAGSAQLRRLVVAEAETAVEGLPLDDVIDRRPLQRAATWLAVAAVAMAICLAFDARAVWTAVARLAAPLGSIEWPRQNHLAFRDAPERLAAGQTFEVELIDNAGPLPDEVRIQYRTARDGRREINSESMTRAGDVMVARRENVGHSFAFRAYGGDDDTMRWHWVEVVEPPQLDSLTLTAHPPGYTGFPPVPADRHLQVLAGTGIEVSGTANKPLSAARILIDGAEPIAASIGGDARTFHFGPEQWIAAKSGPYQLELTDEDGLAGVVGKWNLRVEPDPPPSVAWLRPTDDLYVTAGAVVPIEVAVKDNLAIQRVDLRYERPDLSEAEEDRGPTDTRIDLYRGPEPLAPASNERTGTRGESRIVEYNWDLASLKLPVGAQLTVHVEAADYRPSIGRTVGPRRVTVITSEELEARLADRQAQIVRRLERALAIEQSTRKEVRRLEIQQSDAGALSDIDRNSLQSAELNQRRARRTLVDPAEGVPAIVDSLTAELDMNRFASTDMRDTMDRLTAELERLSSGPLNVAERELTAARKANEASATNVEPPKLSQSLTSAGAAQDDIIATLERLVNELSGKADYHRFARLLAELRQEQIDHEKTSRAEIGLETLPLQVSELTHAQRADLDQAAAGQTAIAARLEKIEQGMDRLARELVDEDSEAAALLSDAVDLARRLIVGAKMQESARDLSENRVARALARETQIVDDLQQVLNVLRKQDERRPEELVDKLRDAESRLAALRQQLAALRKQISNAEQLALTAPNDRQLQQLIREQQLVRRDIEQLARQLERLQANDASQSVQTAANRLENRRPSESASPRNRERPSPSRDVQRAEQDLEQAAKQLAERRQQAEDDLALNFIRRFQAELGELIERQRRVIEETGEIDRRRNLNARLDRENEQRVVQLAEEERRLADTAREHGELLFGLGAVRVSLEEAERRLAAAAERLDERDTGPPTQQAEQHALARLEGMAQAFAQTASEAAQNQGAQPGAGAPAGNSPQRRPTFELLEVKMLRMLQADLKDRTAEYHRQLAGLIRPPDDVQRAELENEARELAVQQGRLAELVQNMLTRDNDESQE